MTRVYKYHCEPATSDDAASLCEQIRLAADYRRELALIENRARVLARTRPDEELRAQIHKHQSLAARAAREKAVDAGLHWGTYQHADEAFGASCRTTKFFDDVRTYVPRDVGCAAVHLQPARALAEDDGWIRVGGIVRRGSEIDKSGRVRPARHHEVSLRVGTNKDPEHRGPRWAKLYVLMHRELPKGGIVSWAMVKRYRVGSKYRWELLITVTDTTAKSAPPSKIAGSVVGVDIGWRQLDGHVRIASWWGNDGRTGEATISNYVLSGDAKSDSLRAIRDGHKNEIRTRIREWVAAYPDRSAWIVEATTAIHSWLKTWRFVRLANRWRNERIPGDELIYAEVVAWLKHDRHLWDWEGAGRLRRKRQVDEQIRLLAVKLGREYEKIGIEAPLVAQLVKKVLRCEACRELPKRCTDCRTDERLRRLAATRVPHAAPARARQEIKLFGATYGATVIEIDPAYTTMDCASCGHRRDDVVNWAPREILCSACGVMEDQDRTAARNLARLASAVVLGDDGKPLASEKSRRASRKLGARRTRKAPKKDHSQTTP